MRSLGDLVAAVGVGTSAVIRETRPRAEGPPFHTSPAWEGQGELAELAELAERKRNALQAYCEALASYYSEHEGVEVTPQAVYDRHRVRLDKLVERPKVDLYLRQVTARLRLKDLGSGPYAGLPMLERYVHGGQGVPTEREIAQWWAEYMPGVSA